MIRTNLGGAQVSELMEKLQAVLDVQDEVWTMDRCAKELGYKKGTIQTMAYKNEIPHRKVDGKKIMFLKSDIVAWLRDGKRYDGRS